MASSISGVPNFWCVQLVVSSIFGGLNFVGSVWYIHYVG